MSNLMLASLAGLSLITVAMIWLWTLHLRKDTTRAAMRALAAMNWHDFSGAVLDALHRRGLTQALESEAQTSTDPQPGFLLTKDNQRWLLWCKHGSAYHIGALTMDELAQAGHLRNADGVILATQGEVRPEGLAAAQQHGIEVLYGLPLWQAVRNHLAPAVRDDVEFRAKARARRYSWISAASGLAVAVAVFFWTGGRDASPIANVAASESPLPQALAPGAPIAPAALAASTSAANLVTDEASLDQQRQQVSKALPSMPGVIRGLWISKMTLVVDRSGEEALVWPRVCSELERYPSLRTSRVQMNPRPGSDDPVRWRQCRTM